MSLENFDSHDPREPVEAAVKKDIRKDILPRICSGWGIAVGIIGVFTAVVMYSRLSAGQSMDDDSARGLTTLAGVAVIIGLMGFLAGQLMRRINSARLEFAEFRAELREPLGCWSDLADRVEVLESGPAPQVNGDGPRNLRSVGIQRKH